MTHSRCVWRTALAGLCLFALSSVAAAQRTERRELSLMVGEQTLLPAENVKNYSQSVRGIVDVRLSSDASQFVVVALREGQTTLLLIMHSGETVQYVISVSTGEVRAAVEEKDNIRLDFYFVQFDESYSHDLGLFWPPFLGAGDAEISIETRDFSNFAGTTTVSGNITLPPLPRLDLLQTNGWARVLRQSALITANGTEARLMSGGEINVPLSGLGGGDIKQIHFGAEVTVLPNYDRSTGRIEMKITAEMSDLTDDRGTGLPGRKLADVESVVNLELGQSVVLGGVISESEFRSHSGLPGLSQIPILGFLFGSGQRRVEATQNVLFIIPTVVDVVPLQARERIRDALRVYWDYSGDWDEVELLPMPPGVPSASEPGAVPTTAWPTRQNAPAEAPPTPPSPPESDEHR